MIKKTHKKKIKTLTNNCYLLKYGSCGFKILSNFSITKEKIFSLERNFLRKIKSLVGNTKNYKVWNLMIPNKTLTKLSLESRMGKGKGSIISEVLFLKKGSIIFECMNLKYQYNLYLSKYLEKSLFTKFKLILKK